MIWKTLMPLVDLDTNLTRDPVQLCALRKNWVTRSILCQFITLLPVQSHHRQTRLGGVWRRSQPSWLIAPFFYPSVLHAWRGETPDFRVAFWWIYFLQYWGDTLVSQYGRSEIPVIGLPAFVSLILIMSCPCRLFECRVLWRSLYWQTSPLRVYFTFAS